MTNIIFTPAKLLYFKRAIQRAEEQGNETFFFEGCQVDVVYAKHMVAYLDREFPATSNRRTLTRSA